MSARNPVCLAAFFVAFSVPRALSQPTFQGLGMLPGDTSTYPMAISGSGAVVVGGSNHGDQYTLRAFRWTAHDGIQTLGDPPTGIVASNAMGVSYDGSVIVGQMMNTADRCRAFRWTADEGIVSFHEVLPNNPLCSGTGGVSDDGSVFVGWDGNCGNSCVQGWQRGGFRFVWPSQYMTGWDWDGMHPNGDGSILAGGRCCTTPPARYLILPDGTRVNQFLGSDPGLAYDISPDGDVVVGRLYSLGRAFCWSVSGLACPPLDNPQWRNTQAWGVSADGGVVVGTGLPSPVASDSVAFIADRVYGIRPLQEVLENHYGLDLTGWRLTAARGVSDDGKTIMGIGAHEDGSVEGWIAQLPTYPVPIVPTVSGWGLVVIAVVTLITATLVVNAVVCAGR